MPDKSKPIPEITPYITGFNVIPQATTPAVVNTNTSLQFYVMFIVRVVTCF